MVLSWNFRFESTRRTTTPMRPGTVSLSVWPSCLFCRSVLACFTERLAQWVKKAYRCHLPIKDRATFRRFDAARRSVSTKARRRHRCKLSNPNRHKALKQRAFLMKIAAKMATRKVSDQRQSNFKTGSRSGDLGESWYWQTDTFRGPTRCARRDTRDPWHRSLPEARTNK